MTKMLRVAAFEKSNPVCLIILVKFEDPLYHAGRSPCDHQEGSRIRLAIITRCPPVHKRLLVFYAKRKARLKAVGRRFCAAFDL